MKTKRQIFFLDRPRSYFEPTEPLILWTVRMYDHVLVMPELTALIQNYYCLN
jgi:hypothetical protein